MNKSFLLFGIVGLVLIFFGFSILKNQPAEKSEENISPTPEVSSSAQSSSSSAQISEKVLELPKMEIDKNKKYTAILTTSKGAIKIELFADKTPITVNNFVYLSRKNFYDNTIFHRVIKGFMIQGGDPKGDGTGGPGYKFDDEPFDGEYTRGTVAMANAGPNTNGSQFFIMHQDYSLPKNYVIFGKVVEGLDVVDKIAESQVESSASGEDSKPVEPTVVKSVEITES